MAGVSVDRRLRWPRGYLVTGSFLLHSLQLKVNKNEINKINKSDTKSMEN